MDTIQLWGFLSLLMVVASAVVITPKAPQSGKVDFSSPSKKPWKAWTPHKFRDQHGDVCPDMDPLILTPMIRNGDIAEAQEQARVHLPGTNVTSYSGYLTVNQSDSSQMFFWFFQAEVAEPENAPVVVWLQGGPGATSMFGLFDEHGPFYVTDDLRLIPRDYRWTLLANMLYIDNPVGTGWSFTKSDDGYARNQDQVGKNLYEALLQFYELFPRYQKSSDLYITGESYGGKYVPALGYTVHMNNQKSKLKLPFKGVAIGNGWVDPENMLDYGDLLYNIGMADDKERDYINAKNVLVKKAIQEERYLDAFEIEDPVMDGDRFPYPTYFFNISGSRYYYNFLQSTEPAGFSNYLRYLNQCHVRSAIHVGNQVFDGGLKVEKYLLEDIYKTAKHYLVPLMENYKVMLYNGQLDIICALPLTENFLSKLEWKRAEEYKKANKFVWKVQKDDVEAAGYVRMVGSSPPFYQVGVRAGGHMLPYDQPRFSFDLIYRFLNERSFRD
ncbi:hypothetical protein RvY_10443 [Ramazzottius varieornatus]|uniref:Carboxypeptidase n=1 Tax=Ramazzottius varieornatus TaxID=947166 RepID=A0A1D1VLS9_RAMVA|nr:hypothetical protein RvY_10443 [Ramazzottius varieornatus]